MGRRFIELESLGGPVFVNADYIISFYYDSGNDSTIVNVDGRERPYLVYGDKAREIMNQIMALI